MRFWRETEPKRWSKRIVHQFLIFPKELRVSAQITKATWEVRWLESTSILQEYRSSWQGWVDDHWASEEEIAVHGYDEGYCPKGWVRKEKQDGI